MKTMKIEKELQFADHVKEPQSLQIQDDITYQKEAEGIRALGTLHIQGSYINEAKELQEYQELLDLDVLAPNHKLSQERFYLDIQEYQAVAFNEGLKLLIHLGIHGIQDVAPQQSTPNVAVAQDAMPESVLHTLEQLSAVIPKAKQPSMEKEEGKASQEREVAMSEFEDLFEDDETTYTSYRMVVARGNDSYSSIAQRYDVKEEALRQVNNDKTVTERTLIILPTA